MEKEIKNEVPPYRKKIFVRTAFSLVCMAFGFPALYGMFATEVYCEGIKCDQQIIEEVQEDATQKKTRNENTESLPRKELSGQDDLRYS